ncbi:MAG: orotate phosphoribosyltransferase [Sedimentisphaerales bacterium]|nr:orotate phosphoribosyltransferase [Sedimentisphaerales bacterium]
METYKKDFIEFLVRAGVLTFSDFTTKSGRKTPYFVNTGNYRMGAQLARLGEFYAQAIINHFGRDFDNLYGPAYKGIPLATAAGIALAQHHGRDVSVTYNRKEAKDHGEKGVLIGHQYTGAERIVIIEDVITAGTSIRETMTILAANNNPAVAGVIVSVDRMERGQGALSALQEVRQKLGFPVAAIVTVRDIIDHLHNTPIGGNVLVNDAMRDKMEAYLKQYGSSC